MSKPTIEQRLEQWKQELLDLTNRNRLLSFNPNPSTSRISSIELLSPEVAELYRTLIDGKALQIVGNPRDNEVTTTDDDEDSETSLALIDTSAHSLPRPGASPNRLDPTIVQPTAGPGTVLSAMTPERTGAVAGRLFTQARASEQEQGINTLFLALGRLKWRDKPAGSDRQPEAIGAKDGWRYAPLVMLPLKLEEISRKSSYRIRAAGEDPEFNQTLAERFRRDFGISLGIEMDEGTALADVFEAVRGAIAAKPEWEVLEDAHIALFQFHKLRMYTDLTQHSKIAAEHEIIQALGQDGAVIAPLPDGIPREDELDRVVSPRDTFTVLDADASQLWAVQAAARGANLIIQGPPGTGKSQTITNIIAECIAAGKTVLFVSEKAAAIEVVHRRLTDTGLGEFCLMLHSQKSSKKDVITDLGSRLDYDAPSVASAQEDLALRRLQDTRIELNAYPAALHEIRHPLGVPAFWAHWELAKLHEVPYLDAAPPPVAELTLDQLEMWSDLMGQVARHAGVLNDPENRPWAGIRQQDLSLTDQQSLQNTIPALRTILDRIVSEGRALAEQVKLPAPASLSEARNLAFIVGTIPLEGGLRTTWLDPSKIAMAQELAANAVREATAARTLVDRLHITYSDAILAAATPDAIAAYESGAIARFFSSTFRRVRGELRAATKDGQQRPLSEELASLIAARTASGHLDWFRRNEPQLSQLQGRPIGTSTTPDVAAWEKTKRGLDAAAAILARFPGTLPPGFVDEVAAAGAAGRAATLLSQLSASITSADAGFDTLRAYFAPGRLRAADVPLEDATFDAAISWLNLRQERFGELDPWLRARAAFARVEAAGLQDIVRNLVAAQVPSEHWSNALRRLVLTHWLDGVYAENDALREFRGDEHEETINRFKLLDRASIATAAHRLRRTLAQRQGRVISDHGGEPQLLRFESKKRARHMPLRRLFERIPNLVPTLKPCLMMSPLSVAQFLPADLYRFDVVIFDEASQVRPHDAIGAIMRGKQLVVAGDSMQLPPTSFFERANSGDPTEDEQNLKDLDSILDALDTIKMKSSMLLWHYRSQHEDLIAYSNQYFYRGTLITFPTPAADRTPTRGVRLDFVPNATYEDERDAVLRTSSRVNRVEARRVAALVMQHARTRPEESLAVVTLNTRQQEIVEDEIQQARSLDRSLDDFFSPEKPEPFFVKALELIQGDERDVIMIGIGFGKNAQGTLSHNFGPINLEGGERRLNVLVTRARHQVIVVSSIRAGDIDEARTKKTGPLRLKQYLDFAERGSKVLESTASGGTSGYESPFEFEVGEALVAAGYDVRRQVGCSGFRIDLAIVDPKQPGRYLLGIECDGATYHSSKTARDRDRLRQEVLERLGWRIHRIWSTDWVRSRQQELDRVVARIDSLLAGNAVDPAVNEPDDGLTDFGIVADIPAHIEIGHPANLGMVPETNAPASDGMNNSVTVPYRIATTPVVGYDDILSTPIPRIAEAIVACVDVEGPIHRDLLYRRIATEWGYQRAGSKISRHIDQAVVWANRDLRVRQIDLFLWPANNAPLLLRGPAEDGWIRDIAHITDQEIALAMKTILTHAFSLSESDLVFQTARLFGYQRTGPEINRRLKEVIALGLKSTVIEDRGGRIQLRREERPSNPAVPANVLSPGGTSER